MGTQDGRSTWAREPFGTALVETTIGALLDEQARAFSDKEALVYAQPDCRLRLTYRQLREEADRVARGLMALGVGRGDHVAVLAASVPQWVLLEMAVPRIGAVLVTVNTNYRQEELAYLLRQADVHTLVLMREWRGNDYLGAFAALVPEAASIADPAREALASAAFPRLRRAVLLDALEVDLGGEPAGFGSPDGAGGAAEAGGMGDPDGGPPGAGGPPPDELGQPPHERSSAPDAPGLLPFARLRALGQQVPEQALRARQAAVGPHDTFQIQFTSGTTGAPKGAMISHHGAINNARLVALRARLTHADRYASAMPLFHTAGSIVDQLSMLAVGGTVVRAVAFEPALMVELVERERATVMDAVPTMLIAMLQQPRVQAGGFAKGSLRCVISGGTPIPVPVMEQVKALLGAEPAIVFGMTEASPIIAQTLPDDPFELRSATVGVPQAHTDLRIVDAQGEATALGEPGELLVRGYLVMKGYYGQPERTAQAIDANGWLHSGDLATMDAGGYVRIVGRIKDMIIRGGENVYPAEVEGFLMRHPAVRQAQVVGVPDAYLGEESAAFVQLHAGAQLTEDALRDWCRAHLSRHKLPRHIRFVADYPQTPSGKVKKFELREALIKELQA